MKFESFKSKDEEKGFILGLTTMFNLVILVFFLCIFFNDNKESKELVTYRDTERTYFYQEGRIWSIKNNITDSWWIKDHQ